MMFWHCGTYVLCKHSDSQNPNHKRECIESNLTLTFEWHCLQRLIIIWRVSTNSLISNVNNRFAGEFFFSSDQVQRCALYVQQKILIALFILSLLKHQRFCLVRRLPLSWWIHFENRVNNKLKQPSLIPLTIVVSTEIRFSLLHTMRCHRALCSFGNNFFSLFFFSYSSDKISIPSHQNHTPMTITYYCTVSWNTLSSSMSNRTHVMCIEYFEKVHRLELDWNTRTLQVHSSKTTAATAPQRRLTNTTKSVSRTFSCMYIMMWVPTVPLGGRSCICYQTLYGMSAKQTTNV